MQVLSHKYQKVGATSTKINEYQNVGATRAIINEYQDICASKNKNIGILMDWENTYRCEARNPGKGFTVK